MINYGDKSGAACAESEAGGYADYYDGGGRDDDDDKSSISSGEYVDEREALAAYGDYNYKEELLGKISARKRLNSRCQACAYLYALHRPLALPDTARQAWRMARLHFTQALWLHKRAAAASFHSDDQELMLRRLRNAVHRLGTISQWFKDVVEDLKLTVSVMADIKSKRNAHRLLCHVAKLQAEMDKMDLDVLVMFNRKFRIVRRRDHECMS